MTSAPSEMDEGTPEVIELSTSSEAPIPIPLPQPSTTPSPPYKVGVCQHMIFQTILNLQFSQIGKRNSHDHYASQRENPLPPLYFYPSYVKSHQDEQRTISPLEETSVQSHSVSLWDIQPSKSSKCLSIAKGFNDYY